MQFKLECLFKSSLVHNECYGQALHLRQQGNVVDSVCLRLLVYIDEQDYAKSFNLQFCTPCPQKTEQICFCQNFVKFAPIFIIFDRKTGNDPNICEVHSFSTSPNMRHHLTVLNTNVPNCYITPKLLVIDRSHWRPQFNRRRRTFRDHSNFRQFVHICSSSV